MINFCIDDLTESIVCDKIPFEGYDAKNLISKQSVQRSKGFLTEYFVRPPVNISFGFVCDIDIAYVVIKLSVGSQRSELIELYTSCCLGEKKIASFNNCTPQDIVSFHIYGKDPSPRRLNSFSACPFYVPRALKDVSRLTLKILRTAGSCTPAIGFIEVYGSPSLSVPREVADQVKLKWDSFVNSKNGTTEAPSNNSQVTFEEKKASIARNLPKTTIIPEDFIDPITCDIMLVPMVLPCGKTIDKRTLERCKICFEQLGRPVSDPFTGLELGDSHQPVLDFALKARIDKFLVDHSNEDSFKTIPRILGQQPNASVPGPSKCQPQDSYKNLTSEMEISRKSSIYGNASSSESLPKRARLEDIIQQTLSSLPSYTTVTETPPPKEIACEVCSSKYALFKIPCEHLICRTCLVSKKDNFSCMKCSKPFKSSDPVRFHCVN